MTGAIKDHVRGGRQLLDWLYRIGYLDWLDAKIHNAGAVRVTLISLVLLLASDLRSNK
ncbi:MAG: hypothetical protein NVSMB6_03710 [Burkholderiaceae bacterium]